MTLTKRKSTFIAGGILLIGVLGLVLMVALRAEPPKVDPPNQSPLVSVVAPQIEEGPLTIVGNGTVQPVREISLAAEVAGKIVSVSPSLVSGGAYKTGDVLVRIDPTNYENAVAVAEAEVIARKFAVLTAEQEVTVAKEEWERLQKRNPREEPETTDLGVLVLKEPQLRAAKASLRSAEARLSDAKTALDRTNVRAPFNGLVRAKSVDLGQFLNPGQAVASIYSTDEAEIRVPLSSQQAALVANLWQPDGQTAAGNSSASVTAEVGGITYQWDGYVHRVEGALDATTRTIGVVVRVEKPYRLNRLRPPLMVGTFVRVAVEGITPDRYFSIPRTALRENQTVWTVTDGRLEVRQVEVIQEEDERVFVAGPLTSSDIVATSALSVFSDGMQVRVDQH